MSDVCVFRNAKTKKYRPKGRYFFDGLAFRKDEESSRSIQEEKGLFRFFALFFADRGAFLRIAERDDGGDERPLRQIQNFAHLFFRPPAENASRKPGALRREDEVGGEPAQIEGNEFSRLLGDGVGVLLSDDRDEYGRRRRVAVHAQPLQAGSESLFRLSRCDDEFPGLKVACGGREERRLANLFQKSSVHGSGRKAAAALPREVQMPSKPQKIGNMSTETT